MTLLEFLIWEITYEPTIHNRSIIEDTISIPRKPI
jgi:hypothetical protein